MGRRKKSKNIEEAIVMLDEEIVKTEELLKELKAQKKELVQQKEDQDLKLLYEKIKESGKSVTDVISAL